MKNYLWICPLVKLILLISLLSCSKADPINPFENETVLDCKNLKIRKVILTDNSDTFPGLKVFRLTMENTCKLCDETSFQVYESFYMIDKNSSDTIGLYGGANLAPPLNKSSLDYDLEAKVNALPNLDNIKFVLYSTCLDIKYEPK